MRRTGVAEGIKRFLQWAMQAHSKSQRYMLVLYGHGPVVPNKAFLARENPPSSLRMRDIPKILKPHFGDGKRKLDILAFQNCAMNSVETAYELKDHVEYMIGSQGPVLAAGWPYEKIIGSLVNSANSKTEIVARRIMKACARHLLDFAVMDRASEQSMCDLSKLSNRQNITTALAELSIKLQETLQFKLVAKRNQSALTQKVLEYPVICDAVRLARLEAQSYWGETFVDLYDFCQRLLKRCNQAVLVQYQLFVDLKLDESREPELRNTKLMRKLSEIIQCCISVMKRVKEMVPDSYYIGSDLQYSRGLSIYFPWSMPGEPYTFRFRKNDNEHVLLTAFETYSEYDFVERSGWARFLKEFYKATLRKVRRAEQSFSLRNVEGSLSSGMVRETHHTPGRVLTTEYLQKTDSNASGVDCEIWSSVKNYPRRNYLSPSDCPRKVEQNGNHRPGQSRYYPNRLSPPVSYLGWNICTFVADVIDRKPNNSNKRNRRP